MNFLSVFLAGFAMSFIGSIPPGTLNISVLQLGLEHRMNIAFRFAVAAALVEYPYAWIAVKFQDLLLGSPVILSNIQLIAALVLIILGGLNLFSAGKSSKILHKVHKSGFRRGAILSILNPMALPYWIGVTAYLKSIHIIALESNYEIHGYLLGITIGAFVLLVTVAYSARWMVKYIDTNSLVNRIPGLTLLVLGLYGLLNFIYG
jgi:threonine/homoserine/homoserine lactone efflux protein